VQIVATMADSRAAAPDEGHEQVMYDTSNEQ
jgi:hypothetical protein